MLYSDNEISQHLSITLFSHLECSHPQQKMRAMLKPL